MRTVSRWMKLAALGALGVSGCCGWLGGNSAGLSGTAKAQTYDEYAKDYQQRSVVAPGMGLDNKPEPSAMEKFGSSVASVPSKIGSSVKSGAAKVGSWFTPTQTAAASNTTSVFAKKPEASADLHVATARVYEKTGNVKAASEEYEKALKQKPEDVATLLSYAHLLDHEGKLSDATRLYQRAVKASPKEPAANNDLGLCLARRGLLKDSTAALTKAVELKPDRALYRNNLATVLVQANRTDEALAQLGAVHGEATAHYNLAVLLDQHHQDTLAQAHLRRALELNPALPEAREWAQRLAAGANGSPNAPRQAVVATPTRVAAVSAPNPRPGAYGVAPEPSPAGSYARPEMAPPNGAGQPADRFPRVSGPTSSQSGDPTQPPTPENVGAYQPNLNATLRFLPPVQ